MKTSNKKFIKSVALILVICMVLMTLAALMVVPFTVYGTEDASSYAVNELESGNAATNSTSESAKQIGERMVAYSAAKSDPDKQIAGLLKSDGTEKGLTQSMSIIQDIMLTIKKDYKDTISYDQLIDGAVNGIFDSLDDYSEFYNTTEAVEDFTNQLDPQYEGIGVELGDENGQLTVVTVTIGSPAEKAGIKAGDIILSIDGKQTKGMSVSDAIDLLRGEQGTNVVISVKRGTTTFEKTITRESTADATIYAGTVNDTNIGYLLIDTFGLNTSEEFRSKKEMLINKGVKSLIIDVRYNGGGYLDAAYQIAEQLLPKGAVIYNLIQQDKMIETVKATQNGDTTTPIVILVNEYSASATEIFAGALKDNNRAKIVGIKTFGKGIAQEIYSIQGTTSAFKLSTFYFTTPKNDAINETGVTPHYIVENYTRNDVNDLINKADTFAPLCEDTKYYASMTGLNVYAAQQRLELLGYLTPTNMSGEKSKDLMTAVMDERTVEAIKNFQADNGLYPYGGLDFTTRDTIIRAVKEKIENSSIIEQDEDVQLLKGIEILSTL